MVFFRKTLTNARYPANGRSLSICHHELFLFQFCSHSRSARSKSTFQQTCVTVHRLEAMGTRRVINWGRGALLARLFAATPPAEKTRSLRKLESLLRYSKGRLTSGPPSCRRLANSNGRFPRVPAAATMG